MKLSTLLLIITFILGCTDQDAYLIRVEQDAVFVENKKIANTVDIAEQDSFFVDTLQKALESRKDTSKNCSIKIDPEQSYDVLFKIASTCNTAGYTNLSIVSKINGEDDIQPFSLNDTSNTSRCGGLDLYVAIDEDTLEIWARGGSLPKIYRKANPDSAYNELVNSLIMVREHFIKFGYTKLIAQCAVNIIADYDTKISNIIPVMRIIKTTGFTEINLRIIPKPKPPTDWSKYLVYPDIAADFKDSNFLAAVRKNLDKGEKELIYRYEVEKITSLVLPSLLLPSQDIKSVAGIEHFVNLERLECGKNQLVELDVSKNPKLWLIQCDDNKLAFIKISGNTNLKHISIDNNQLVELDVSGAPALEDLYISGNQLTSLNLTFNTILHSLDVSNNLMPSEASVKGFNGKWDGKIFVFEPQKKRE